MSESITATNAASSGIVLDRKKLKSLSRRSDGPGLKLLLQWIVALLASGYLVWISLGSLWVWPAMFIYGTFLTVTGYAMSHETAHGTAFKNRTLNEVMFWISSLIYLEEPLHRRYTHTSHHTYTLHVERDAQIPSDLPMTFKEWLWECSGITYYIFEGRIFWQLATKQYADMLRQVSPESELPRMTRNARIFLAIYAVLAIALLMGQTWILWFIILPRMLGAIPLGLVSMLQHAEMSVNANSILDSTRSFKTNKFLRFVYMDMNYHVEHHLYPQVPFYGLSKLHEEIRDQIPEPDPGFFRTSLEFFNVVWNRSRGKNTRAASIRQAPELITEGEFVRTAKATM